MFNDLKSFAQGEEQIKMDFIENRTKLEEAEILNQDLLEKTQNQELKIRNLQNEMEKTRREQSYKQENERMFQQSMDDLANENKQLRERLSIMEQDKINLVNDKERRERDCKNMQNELNRISSMVHVRIFISPLLIIGIDL